MSKELECLKRIDTKNYLTEREHKEFYSVVEGALIKAEENKTDIIHYKGTVDNLRKDNALLKERTNGQEKVLEILFKKQVDLGWLWYCIYECVNSLNEYNKKMPIEKFKLTEEEYDLIKRYYDKYSYKNEEDILTKKEYDLLKGC